MLNLNAHVMEDFKKGDEKWGETFSWDMFIEEASEAIVAFQHYKRGRIPLDEVLEELVDTTICAAHAMTTMADPREIEEMFDKKMDKMKGKLNENT